MHSDQAQVAEELIAALGMLGQAQEFGADDDRLSELTAHVRVVEREFRTLVGQAR